REVLSLIGLLAGRSTDDARILSHSLSRLAEALERVRPAAGRGRPGASRRFQRTLRRIAGIVAAAAPAVTALPAAAQVTHQITALSASPLILASLPTVVVGDVIFNPLTGLDEEIVEVLGDGSVLTD